jgi:intraflagellar transport protein 81
LMPIDIPPEFMNDELVLDLSAHLKELQAEFKTVHKAADKIQSSGARPAELKAEIAQLEQEHTQLQVNRYHSISNWNSIKRVFRTKLRK